MTVPCPKCGRPLEQSGTVEIDGAQLPAFQCDVCTRDVEVMGTRIKVAITFCLLDGGVFDPSAPDGQLRW
jgi:hypothetical protein